MTRASLRDLLTIAPEVARSLETGRPVVALESAVIAHGLPAPDNLTAARQMAAAVRRAGAVPAVVALLDGRVRIGLDDADLELLATAGHVRKVSRRDIPLALSRGQAGATTVAATLALAALAGITVFATGGIGGVHRGAAQTLDVSADLAELARSHLVVVCSGPKTLLDIRLTREVLETLGIPILGYETDRLPAFYCRETAAAVDERVASATEVAVVARTKWALGLDGAILVAVPVPDGAAIPPDELERWLEQAIQEADAGGRRGWEVTPAVLARLHDLSDGRTLRANLALLERNAAVAGAIAVALAEG
ncbi:MAG: pseudouridine-5'-phosphate glycosidase [Chloroflexi bacterium]|nr:pseudouridine-5'-phosphate glycosidase [Chloroflexota bacterium]